MRSKHQKLGCIASAAKAKAIRNAKASRVLDLIEQGVPKPEIMQITGLSRTTINSYLREYA